MRNKNLLIFLIVFMFFLPKHSYCQQALSWNDIIELIKRTDLGHVEKIGIVKDSGFNCESSFPDDYPVKLMQVERNKLFLDAIIEEINKCKKTLTIVTKPTNASIYIDLEKKGESNSSGIFDIKIRPRKYFVKVSKDGYYDTVRTIVVEEQEKIEIFEMVTRLYTINFDSDPKDVEIFQLKNNDFPSNVKRKIENNILQNLRTGDYYFDIKKEGYVTKREKVLVNNDFTFKVKLDKKIIPLPPNNVTSDVFRQEIIISWDKVENASKYVLYYGENENLKQSKSFVITAFTDYSIKDLKKNIKYYFAVSSLNEWGDESELGQMITRVSPIKERPLKPTEIKVFPGRDYAFVEWNKVEDADSYNIYFKEGDFDSTIKVNVSAEKISKINITKKTIEKLKNGEKYSFIVTAQNNVGESDYSKSVSVNLYKPMEAAYVPDKPIRQIELLNILASLEYLDALRIASSETLSENANINYIAKYIKLEYEIKKNVYLFLKTGLVSVGLPNDYGDDSLAYGFGLRVENIMNKEDINVNLKLDYLNFTNKSSVYENFTSRKINYSEVQAGIACVFKTNTLYNPYIGVNQLMANGNLGYSYIDSSKNESHDFHLDKIALLKYSLGLTRKIEKYNLDLEINIPQKFNNIDSLRIGIGMKL